MFEKVMSVIREALLLYGFVVREEELYELIDKYASEEEWEEVRREIVSRRSSIIHDNPEYGFSILSLVRIPEEEEEVRERLEELVRDLFSDYIDFEEFRERANRLLIGALGETPLQGEEDEEL